MKLFPSFFKKHPNELSDQETIELLKRRVLVLKKENRILRDRLHHNRSVNFRKRGRVLEMRGR